MKSNAIFTGIFIAALMAASSCKVDDLDGGMKNNGNFANTDGSLKGIKSFPVGFAVVASDMANAKSWDIVKQHGNAITFGNELKNGSVVQADGTLNFTAADAMYNTANAAGIEVFGHTLVWHSQQRATWYNALIGGGGPVGGASNVLTNGDFETSSTAAVPFNGWAQFNATAGSSFTAAAGGDVRTGTGALKIVTAQDNSGGEWRVQLASPLFNTTVDKVYKVSYWIKATAPMSATVRFSTANTSGGNAQYPQANQNVTTAYELKEFTFTAKDAQTRILIDAGAKANTYFIDDITIVDNSVVPPPSGAQQMQLVDDAMKNYIQAVVTRYSGKIKAWDVINEPFSDGGALRDNTNTPAGTRSDIFVWQHYLGRGYAAKAFQYARAANATADLYMNDYNLESNTTKCDNFVTLAKELKAANTGITGVGTQMHMMLTDSYAGIISMMQKLASTGLKVRISELDIRINPGGTNPTAGYVPTAYDLQLQAAMYKFVVATYIKYVPEAQRGGITLWGVDDTTSWINTTTNVTANKLDYPLLFDKNFQKKPAFSGFLQALQGNGEN
ncbi:endo-1,4-beta-xylanase [Hufsiella ginkgonis]|uniref:Beta-xylanase n=1 Tax=Hufsiella ginkgonis TaxID=2695274 RepID=A0A7K1XU91_9SPHI|nr:endo-1,4-beta-xylanase [Hufsiella ginkgonis]MXV14520.1 hypothetical protein [Hufsiella ginkgonis]